MTNRESKTKSTKKSPVAKKHLLNKNPHEMVSFLNDSIDLSRDIKVSYLDDENKTLDLPQIDYSQLLRDDIIRQLSYLHPKESSETAVIGIAYSGGPDSTLLVLQALKQGFTVLPIIIDFNNDIEKLTRLINLQIIRKQFPKLLSPIYTIDFCNSLQNCNHGQGTPHVGYIQQPFVAIAFSIFNGRPIYTKLTELQVGYIRNDDIIAYKDEWYNLYKAYSAFTSLHNKELIPVQWPLSKYSKRDVYESLNNLCLEFHLDLICTSCELPNITAYLDKKQHIVKLLLSECGTCHKCYTNNEIHPNGNVADKCYLIELPFKKTPKYKTVDDLID